MEANRTLRLFCALDLPEETIEAIVRWQREQAGEGSGWRAVRPESLHLTLVFVGERPEADVEAIAAAIAELPAEPVAAVLRPEPAPMPPRAPRMLALEAAGEQVVALQATLATRLTALGVYEPEARPFWPHVTVLKRSRGAARASGARPRGSRGAVRRRRRGRRTCVRCRPGRSLPFRNQA